MDAKRDWGHAKDYVELMWRILQYDQPEDWVIATGVTTSVRDFIKMSFEKVGIHLKFEGSGVEEVGIIDTLDSNKLNSYSTTYKIKEGQTLIKVNPKYFRPTEVELLIGDPTKAKTKLDWEPKYDLKALCDEMVEADIVLFKKDELLKSAGFKILNQYE